MGLPSTIFPELAQEPDKAPESPITEDILDRVRRVESGGGKYLVSPKGALGPYQIMPATAAEYGINPMQESDARETARRILEKNYIKYGDLNLALMAYHAGQGNIDRYLAGRESGVGPLTLSYPEKVMGAPVATSSLSTKSDDKAIFPELQQASTDKIFPDLIPAPGAFSAEGAPEKKAPQKGAVMRGLETQFEQTKALAPGLVGLVGATGEAAFGEGGTWSDLKNWGLTGYQTRMKSIEEKAAETDDVLKAWEKAKQGDLGALLEWGKFGLGYLAGNIGEAVITGGVGSLVGKAAFKYAGEGVLRGMVAKEAAKLAEKEAAGTGVALGAKELAERAAAPELIEAATRNVAGRVGSIAALAGTNIAKETGSIYGEAEEEAEKKGKKLNGADLARIWGSGLVAGLSEAAVDRLGLDIAGGRLKIPGTGRVGSAMVGSALGAGVEGAQEFLQTAIERYGAAKELSGSDAYRDYINSVALGALGGGTVGGVIGAFRGKGISREEAEAALKAAQEELNAKAEEAGKVLGTDAETVRAANDILLALPPPEKGKYGPDYGFTRRGEREGEGVDIVRTPEERIEEFRRQQKAEAEAPVETPAEPRRIGFEPFDEEGALRGEGFTMRGAEEDVAPVPQEEFKPAGLIETRIRDVEPLPPREVAEIRLSELSDGDRVTKAWLSEQTGEKGKSLDSLWMDLIGDKSLRREGNKFVRNAPEEVKRLPPPEAGKYGPGYRFTSRDLQPGEGLPVSEGERLKEQAEARRGAEELRALPKPVEQPTKITETKFSRDAGIYYSTLEKATRKLPPSGTGQQMLASLQNIPGVKPNEIVATGLDTWLPEQGRVTREQVQEYVAQNAVEIREVTNREGDRRAAELRRLANTRGLTDSETNELIALEKAGTADETRAPKFNLPDTTLPGGTNYREVLLTLPAVARAESNAAAAFAREMREKYGERWIADAPMPELRRYNQLLSAQDAKEKAATFKAGHFDEPNVLAHIRLNDRTDADGKRVLFVEEIQSDWHQKGRRQGYASEREKLLADVIAAEKASIVAHQLDRPDKAEKLAAYNAANDRLEKFERAGKAVPDAPFKKDWHELAFRRVLKMAADEGYDRVAWTTGDQQNERYDLSKRLQSVNYEPPPKGGTRTAYVLTAKDKDGKRIDLGAHEAAELDGVVGKELADKIRAGEGEPIARVEPIREEGGNVVFQVVERGRFLGNYRTRAEAEARVVGLENNERQFTGLDLKVGGSGMIGFYDKMLPAYANKFGKKYGAKVGDTVITTPKPEKVHSINITPQMRDALREGIPLFSRSDRDADNPPTPSKLLRQEKISDTLITEDFENPQTREEQKVRVSRAMKDALAHVLGPGVDVRVVDQVLGKWDGQWHPAGGAFDPVEKVIALSMESPNIERAAFHEAIHFLREANVISDADWKLLSEQADKWKDKAYKSTWEKYADKKNETRTEEVIADAFSDWRNGRLDVPNPILRIFHKILDFVQRLKKKIGYEGARSWKDVFTDIESGRYRDLAGQYHMTEMARDGSFALVDSRTARAVGNYQTKKAAITAALDIEAAQNASLRLQRESAIAVDDAATKVAAKHSVDQMIGIAQRKAMFSRMPSLESEATYLTNWWGKAILPVAMAAKDRIFARVWNVVNDRERFTSRIYQDYFSPLRGLSNLSAQEKTNVYKAAVAARMDGIDVKPSKSNVTIKYKGTDDIIDHTTNKVWLKSGETISLNSKETESFFALKNAFKNVWADLNDAAAIKAGFPMDGNIKELRDAAVGDSAKKAAFLQKYKNIPGIDKILGSMTAGIYQERAGYIPFQRYGSVIIAVTRKGAKKGDAPLATILVDADSADMPSVKKARKALEDRYGAVGDVQEPRLVSENDYSGAAMEEMEHLISRLERAAGRDKGDLYKAYIEKVADEFKRGWQRKSRNVLGFSTDFEKVIPEYLSNAAQTNGRMRYANAIDRQMREINNPRGGTPADGVPSKSVRDFTNKWLNYVDNPSNDFSTTRKVGFLWYLWGNLSSAVVNLSQTPLVTFPVVAKWGMNLGQSIAEATKIANLFFSRKVWYMQDGRILLDVDKMNFLSDAEKRAVKGWQQSGLLQNQITNDQAGLGYVEKISNKAVMRNIEKVFQAGASPFALAETINRLTAGLIAYRSALKTGALDKAIKVYEKNQAFQDRFDGGKTLTPEKMAAWTIEETQFFGGKVNTSEIMRGIGSVAFQFKNYTANYLNLMYRSFANEGREGKMAGLAMLAGLMMVSGLRGIPFEGDLEQLLNWITETVTGINPNINMQLKEFARKGLMGAGLPEEQAILGASLMMNGLSRLTSVDLGSRFGQGDIVPNDVNSLFGPVVSAFSVAADGISHVKNGQTFQGTARLVPKAFGNVIESLGYTDQGIKTKAGNEVMGPNEFSTADQIVKALGFQPAKLAERQEIAYDLTQVSEQARKAAGGMARYLANMVVRAENARARGDMEAAEEAMQNYAERLRRYEREMSDPDRPAYMQYKINRDAIKKEIRNALDWRMRFLGGKKMARPEIIEILRRSGESIGA
jgi:hypothetical protein